MDLLMQGRLRSPLVTVTPGTTYQTMTGWGCSLRGWTDPHTTNSSVPGQFVASAVADSTSKAAIYDLLFLPQNLNLNMVRYATDPGFVELTKGVFTFNDDGRAIANHTENIAALVARKPSAIYYGSPLYRESWMTYNGVVDYADWAFRVIKEFHDRGYPIPYWSVANEPTVGGGFSSDAGTTIRDVIKNLGPRLVAAGYATRFMVSDDDNPAHAVDSVSPTLADATALSYVDYVGYHPYNGTGPNLTSLDTLVALAASHSKPTWMSEWNPPSWMGWAQAIHGFLVTYNASAIMNQWGYFGSWEGDFSHYITLNTSPAGGGSNATFVNYSMTQYYYVTQQWSKYVQPGMQRCDVTGPSGVKCSAFTGGGYTTVVALNDTATASAMRVTGVRAFVDGQFTDANNNGVALTAKDVYSLPPNSIVTVRCLS